MLLGWPARWALRQAARACGRPQAFAPPDRRLLEEGVLGALARAPVPRTVLFVGTRWYTASYERRLRGHRFVTLDVDPAAARHGSRQAHLTCCLSEADAHLPAGAFDAVIVNGVFGWGLDDAARGAAALRACRTLLDPGGWLLIGWNDVPGRRPFDIGVTARAAGFAPAACPPLGEAVVRVPGSAGHVFEGYRPAA